MNSIPTISSKENNKSVFFRCDADNDIGIGHVMRCMTLAKKMREQGWDCHFITVAESLMLVPSLEKSSFFIHSEIYQPEKSNLVIIDHYNLDESYETSCRAWADKIMVIDDLANRPHDCDFLLDQNFGRTVEDYKYFVPDHCKVLCGERFILLRKQFLDLQEKAKIKRKNIKRVENIFINFGSTNPEKIIEKILNVLLGFLYWPLHIDIVLSGKADGVDELRKLSSEISSTHQHSIEVHTDADDMASLMLKADMAFGGGGTTSWERACLGLPTVLIILSDDQIIVSNSLANSGAVMAVGRIEDITEALIDNAFVKMRDNSEILGKMSKQSFDVCDGLGASRVVSSIEELYEKD